MTSGIENDKRVDYHRFWTVGPISKYALIETELIEEVFGPDVANALQVARQFQVAQKNSALSPEHQALLDNNRRILSDNGFDLDELDRARPTRK